MSREKTVIKEFTQLFGETPSHVVRAPGRVNLIGEHTDYNEGFVMPLAIEQSLYLALKPREDHMVVVHSLDMGTMTEFDLNNFLDTQSGWGEYIKGTAWALQEHGYELKGWQGVLASDIPIAAGLSSSAALELATAKAFEAVSGFSWDPVRMAQIGQYAENKWIGVNCGIMDQLIVAVGKQDFSVKIDCRSLDFETVPIPDAATIVIIDSSTRRGLGGLVDSAYNERRQQCEEAAQYFGFTSLRDLSLEKLESKSQELDATIYKRARHILTENERVADAARAMRNNDAEGLGAILQEGHVSMRDDFEISREEIDALVEIANAQAECYGARMTGGGFGGCVVSLVRKGAVKEFVKSVEAKYKQKIGLDAASYVTTAQDGVLAHKVIAVNS